MTERRGLSTRTAQLRAERPPREGDLARTALSVTELVMTYSDVP